MIDNRDDYTDAPDAPEVPYDYKVVCSETTCEEIKSTTEYIRHTNGSESMWAVHNQINYFPCERSLPGLPPSQYIVQNSDSGLYFQERSVQVDSLYKFPDSAFDEVIQDIETFWNRQQQFRDFGFLWKRGILLYGPPGSGKTSLLQIVAEMIITRGGIVICGTDAYRIAAGLQLLRRIEPNRPVVVILEDIDAIIRNGENELLALLDGELQVDNIVTIATTNYPERLDRRLINRPSRFDIIKKIDMPSAGSREIYLKHKNPQLSGDELVKWVTASHGYSMAHLKELIVSVECLGNTFDDTIKRLNNMIAAEPTSDEYQTKSRNFGFTDEPKAVRAYK